jgi:branched-chain amino acid transport system substrate-binding protein
MRRSSLILMLVTAAVGVDGHRLAAQPKYDPGASDREIKVGNIVPYSGAASAYALIGRTEAAYFRKINAEGGIQGRRIKFISYDDAYNPAKSMEQARRLVEKDRVLLAFQTLGTAPNTAIHQYMNDEKVPQLFVASGASKWNDPTHFPWTMGWQPSYRSEGRIYAQYLLDHHPTGRIGILSQNDEYGEDLVRGFKDRLAGRIPVIAEVTYESSDADVASQMVKLQSSGADIFLDVSASKFAAQAIRKAAELGWEPVHILNNISESVGSVLKPAGFDNAEGTISTTYFKDPADPNWKDDPALKEWSAFMDRYLPAADRTSSEAVYGYLAAQTLVQVLRQCGDDLTRVNVMKQAANLRGLALGMLLPGITINTGPTDYAPIKQLQMQRFSGYAWERFGPLIADELAGN